MTTSCIFCEIVNKRSPAAIVSEWWDVMAIVPLNPVVEGHLLIIPKIHVNTALQDPDVSATVMRRAAEIAPYPCNLIVNVGEEATQTVFHLHLHIVPRKSDDGLALPWYSGKGNHKAR